MMTSTLILLLYESLGTSRSQAAQEPWQQDYMHAHQAVTTWLK